MAQLKNFKVYLVGGAVRDRVLGVEPNDSDYVVVGATPEIMLEAGFKQVGKDFPVFLHPETGEEYALARKEVKTGPKHTDFKFVFTPDVTLEEDLKRRDLTCNALAQDIETLEIIDYFGGIKDIKNKVLRHTSEHFVEDPLRILRCVRFATCLGFTIAEETKELLKKMVSEGALDHLTPERIWKEIEKALDSSRVCKFILLLDEIDALKIILPEVYALKNIPEKLEYHPEGTTYNHVLCALNEALEVSLEDGARLKTLNDLRKLINFGVLCHDLGKSLTPQEILPAHHGHDERGVKVVHSLCDRLKIPNKYREYGVMASKYHMKCHSFLKMRVKNQYDMIKEVTGFKDFKKLVVLRNIYRADVRGRLCPPDTSKVESMRRTISLMHEIFRIMEGKTLNDLPEGNREILSKHSGETFGKLYRDFMISYLKGSLRKWKNQPNGNGPLEMVARYLSNNSQQTT